MQHMMDVGAYVMHKSTICSGTIMSDQLHNSNIMELNVQL